VWSALLIDILKVIVLGIVEGITEFLPVSSTGHIVVTQALLQPNFSPALNDTFPIFIQLGAVVAVIAYYWRDLVRQVTTIRTDAGTRRLWIAIIIAFVPAALIGLVVREAVKETLFNPVVVAVSLIVGGVLFILLERRFSAAPHPAAGDLTSITLRQATLIGVLQTIALIPGVSRSAASIFGGMLGGLNRSAATQFSFYLAIPWLGSATVVDLVLSMEGIGFGDLLYLGVGAIVSGVVAWFAIGWLLRYVARSSFIPFAYYRIAAGAVILLLAGTGVLSSNL
jgi:undecaprenyl-diphosphatase